MVFCETKFLQSTPGLLEVLREIILKILSISNGVVLVSLLLNLNKFNALF